MSYTLLRQEWTGPDNEVFISFDVYDEEFGTLTWDSDWIDVTDKISESDLNNIRNEIIGQCKEFELTIDLTPNSPTVWGEEWNERVVT